MFFINKTGITNSWSGSQTQEIMIHESKAQNFFVEQNERKQQ